MILLLVMMPMIMRRPRVGEVAAGGARPRARRPRGRGAAARELGRGDDRVEDPHRAQISQFELFELILLLKLDKQFPVEQFEARVSQSTVPSPLLGTPCGWTTWSAGRRTNNTNANDHTNNNNENDDSNNDVNSISNDNNIDNSLQNNDTNSNNNNNNDNNSNNLVIIIDGSDNNNQNNLIITIMILSAGRRTWCRTRATPSGTCSPAWRRTSFCLSIYLSIYIYIYI